MLVLASALLALGAASAGAATLSGTVVDASGAGVAGARVCVGGHCIAADGSGRYSTTLAAGRYEVRTAIAASVTTCSPGSTATWHNFPGDTCTIDLTQGNGIADFRAGGAAGCSTAALVRAAAAEPACCAAPRIAATARVVRNGEQVEVKLIARGLGPASQCGSARILVGSRTHVTTLKRSGDTATGSVRLSGARSCVSTIRATLTEGTAGAATSAPVEGGPRVVTAHAVRDKSGGVEVVARVENLRPLAVCGRAHIRADGVPFPKLKQNATAATGSVHLTGREECTTLVQLVAGQRYEVARAVRAVTGAEPTLCRNPGP